MKKEFTLEVFKRMIGKVVEWNEIGGNLPTDKSLEPIYLTLSREECFSSNEFLQGWFNKDWEMIADGVGDLIFTVGMLGEINGSTVPMYSTTFDRDNPNDSIKYLSSSLIDYDFEKPDVHYNLFEVLLSMSQFMDVESVFDRVHTSNLSKYVHESVLLEGFCLDGEVQHIESQGRYSDVDWKQVGEYFVFTAGQDIKFGVIFDTPKVVKSSRFVDVEELGGLLEFVY